MYCQTYVKNVDAIYLFYQKHRTLEEMANS